MRFFLTSICRTLTLTIKDASYSHRQRWWWICIKALALPRHLPQSCHRMQKRWSQRTNRTKYVVTTASPPTATFRISRRCSRWATFLKSTTTRKFPWESSGSQHRAIAYVVRWSITSMTTRLSISSHRMTAVMVSRQKTHLIMLRSSAALSRTAKRRADQPSTFSKRRCICSIGKCSIVATQPQKLVIAIYCQVTPPSLTNLNKDFQHKIITRIRTKTLRTKVRETWIMSIACTRRCSAHSY